MTIVTKFGQNNHKEKPIKFRLKLISKAFYNFLIGS